jgi:chromosome segregation ATPase
MKFPTPHPRHSDVTPGRLSAFQHQQNDATPLPRDQLKNAFAGVTPQPRMSHPLTQTYIPAASEASDSGGEGSLQDQVQLRPWSPQRQSQSPYESDRASFISTASSHDLTTHHRANTSFDPVMGLGGHGGHGVGRFNAGKLNSYLHGLNRRLQEENEQLVDRLRRVEDEKRAIGSMNESVSVMSLNVGANGGGRRASAGRRVSAGGSGLGDVKEEEEDWAQEKAELEEVIKVLKQEVDLYLSEKEDVEAELEKERSERVRDKERWKERMGEVEKGVEGIVKELEKKVDQAEKQARAAEQDRVNAEQRVIEIEGERDNAIERATKAEMVLERGTELGGDLREANDRVGKIMGDLRNANKQIRELETEVMRSDGRVDELELQLREARDVEGGFRSRIASMEDEARKMDEEYQMAKNYAAELEDDAGAAVDRIEHLEKQLASAHDRIESVAVSEQLAKEKAEKLEVDGQRASDLARQMEEALEAAEGKMKADEEEIVELKGRVVSLERVKEHSKSHQDLSGGRRINGPTEAEMEELEEELDSANREIARLTTLLQQSPARKAIDKAKDTKIEMLEKERDDLMERIKVLRATEIGTPGKIINASGISPIHRQVLSMSMRAPRTPGAPLRDVRVLFCAKFGFYNSRLDVMAEQFSGS